MKMTVGEVIDKVHNINHIIGQLDTLSLDYSYCEDASELLCEYRDLIINTEIDL